MRAWKIGISLLLVLGVMAGMVPAGAANSAPVAVDSGTFPDPAFLGWTAKQDTDGDGYLSQAELDAVTEMDLRKLKIQDLTGLEWFRGLEKLNCSENDLTSLELPDLPALRALTCNENSRLSLLDLSGAPALEHLNCFHSALTELDLHCVPKLSHLAWGGSPLRELDLSGNPDLQVLHVLGGDLYTADLSHNDRLDTLLWNHTYIQSLDLSHLSNLTFLNCTDNQIVSLDLSENLALEAVYAGKNQLLAIRMPPGSTAFCDLSDQRPGAFSLPAGENSISLAQLVPWMAADHISGLSGGTLQDDQILLDAPTQAVTYRYTDEVAVLDAALAVTGENGWKIPLSMPDRTYGEPAPQPQAQPAFGTAVFSYAASDQGPFLPDPPIHAGTWYVRAAVPGTAQYQGLEAVTSFQIFPAVPAYPSPDAGPAVYGDQLAGIPLSPHFFWEDDTCLVGDAGVQTHLARYVPEDLIDYLVVEHIPISIQVSPYDGTRLPIPQISSRSEAEALVIQHGPWTLLKGKDYLTSYTSENGLTRFTIRFQGNYTGTVDRLFSGPAGGGSGSSSGGSVSHTLYIDASASPGGQIAPSGKVRVERGADKLFTFQPDDGYRLDSVWVDGKSAGAIDRYLFKNVTAPHTISVRFVPICLPADPDETGISGYLETQAHDAYFFGYPGALFGPEDPLTRAQAAQLFYTLLKDKDVPITAAFSDVSDGSWYARAVQVLASIGMVDGVGGGRFLPDRPITRAEFIMMAMRAARPADDGTYAFPDVPPEHPAYEAVVSAARYGWIQGTPDGTFGPDLPVTRAQAAAMLDRILGRSADRAFLAEHAADLRRFSDVPASHWAYYDICEAANAHSYERGALGEVWDRLL